MLFSFEASVILASYNQLLQVYVERKILDKKLKIWQILQFAKFFSLQILCHMILCKIGCSLLMACSEISKKQSLNIYAQYHLLVMPYSSASWMFIFSFITFATQSSYVAIVEYFKQRNETTAVAFWLVKLMKTALSLITGYIPVKSLLLVYNCKDKSTK